MEQFQNIFDNNTFRYLKVEKTGFYYAYDMIVEGIKSYCKAVGVDPKWHEGYDEIVEWLHDNKGKGLLVYGDKGCGKSMLCANIIPKILNAKSHNSSWVEFGCSVYDSYDLSHKGTEDMNLLQFVCIDDIGVEEDYNQYGTKRGIFKEIVNNAEQTGRGLILTSNLTMEQLKDKYGSRTIDRLRALVKPIVIKGASMRNGDTGDGYPIPDRHRAYGIDFETEKEAEDFECEQNLLRDYVSYNSDKIQVYEKDINEWHEYQPFRILKGIAYCIPKYEERWKEVDWENDPDRLEYLNGNFYE